MRILLVNDDGIHAKGIVQLARCLKDNHQITVVAPDRECSCESHRVSIIHPIAYKKVYDIDGCECYKVHGSPADCVKVAKGLIVGDKVDLIISGINNGENIGTDLIYSGTVNAAIEGAICGVNSIAVSLASKHNNYDIVCEFIVDNLYALIEMMPDNNTVINVNFPSDEMSKIRGVKICPVGEKYFVDKYQAVMNKYEDYDNCYLLTGTHVPPTMEIVVYDVDYWTAGYVTISPVKFDFTDHKTLSKFVGEEKLFKIKLNEIKSK